MPELKTSVCKGCGAEMVWAKSPTGADIPLDVRPGIYLVTETEQGLVATIGRRFEIGSGTAGYAVNHFKTCPKAADFSGRNKKPAATIPSTQSIEEA